MRFIDVPYLPAGAVKLAVIDGRSGNELQDTLFKSGVEIIRTRRLEGMYEAVSYHPDLMMHHIGYDSIVYAPGVDEGFLRELSEFGFKLIKGDTCLSSSYPSNIAYNVARVGGFALHNLKYTDPVLKMELERRGVSFIHINQGYSKCSISIVDSNSIITSDEGVAKVADKFGIDVLLSGNDENIKLQGFGNGFIGGSTGLIDSNKLAVSGNALKLKSYREICDFLRHKGIELVSLSEGDITDIGSIIPLAC